MKLFEMIIDDGKEVYKGVEAASSKKELMSIYGGNGEFIRIKEVTKDYPIDGNYLAEVLQNKFGKAETKLICELVSEHIRKTYK